MLDGRRKENRLPCLSGTPSNLEGELLDGATYVESPQPKPQNYPSTKLGEVARSAGGVCQSVDGRPTKSRNGQKEQKEYLVNNFFGHFVSAPLDV